MTNERMSLKDKLNPHHTALLVIDIQKDFCSPEGLLAKRGRDLSLMEPMIDRLEEVIHVAEKAKVFVAYSQQIYDRTKLKPLQLEQYDLDGKLVTCDITTGGHEFYRIHPPTDQIYPKYNFNIFSNPQLVDDLRERNIKSLVATGVDSQFCVETAVRNGFDLGYKIVVPEDTIATNARKLHQQETMLELVRSTYGVVVFSKDVVNIWGNNN